MSRFVVQKTSDVNVICVDLPLDFLSEIFDTVAAAIMDRIVSYRLHGDEMTARDYFDLHIDLVRMLRSWEETERNPF